MTAILCAAEDPERVRGWGRRAIAVRLVLLALGQAAMVSGSSTIEFGLVAAYRSVLEQIDPDGEAAAREQAALEQARKAAETAGRVRRHHAAQAASKQDKAGVMEHLKKAGGWALKIARDIGVQVAATVLAPAL
jgi:hypothetical protein